MGSKKLVLNIFALQNVPKTLKLSSLSYILHVKVSSIILKLNCQFHNLHTKLRDLVLNFTASLFLVLVIRFRYLVDLHLLLTNSSRVHSFQQVLVYYIQGKASGVTYNCHLDSVQDIGYKFWTLEICHLSSILAIRRDIPMPAHNCKINFMKILPMYNL